MADTEGEKLTFKQYYSCPLPDLVKHPDFSRHAMRVVEQVSAMTTAQLEQINLMEVM